MNSLLQRGPFEAARRSLQPLHVAVFILATLLTAGRSRPAVAQAAVASPAEPPVDTSAAPPASASVSAAAAAPERPWSFWGGFLSHEFSNPGFHAGVEYALETTRHFQTLATVSLQMYDQADTETAWALQARWGHRYTSGLGITFDHFLGLGTQYTRYDVTAFQFDDGQGVPVSQIDDVFGLQVNLMFGPGFDFGRLLEVPVHLYARPGIIVVYPDLNDAFQLSVVGELGLRWTPKL